MGCRGWSVICLTVSYSDRAATTRNITPDNIPSPPWELPNDRQWGKLHEYKAARPVAWPSQCYGMSLQEIIIILLQEILLMWFDSITASHTTPLCCSFKLSLPSKPQPPQIVPNKLISRQQYIEVHVHYTDYGLCHIVQWALDPCRWMI